MSIELSDTWPYDFVEVLWHDATTDSGWEDESGIDSTDEPVYSYGFLLKKDRKFVVVAGSISCDETNGTITTNNRMKIPRGMVKKVRILFPKTVETKDKPANAPSTA